MANGIPKTTPGDATGEWQHELLEQRKPLDPADPYNRVDPPRAAVGGKKRSLDDMPQRSHQEGSTMGAIARSGRR
jgi:hypothetical protein